MRPIPTGGSFLCIYHVQVYISRLNRGVYLSLLIKSIGLCFFHDIAISAAYLRLVKDESKQCMLPIFKETYIASLPSSLANVYGADTVDMFTTPSIVSLTTIFMFR